MAWSRKCAAAPSVAGAASGPSGWSTNRRGVLAGGQAGVAGMTWAIADAPAHSYAPAPPLTLRLRQGRKGAERKGVVEGKSVSIRFAIVGRQIIKTQQQKKHAN